MSDKIEWNSMNLDAIEQLLEFHCECSTIINAYFEKPWIWFISSVSEIEKLMEMNGNLYVEANDIYKIIEILISQALDTDIRQWFVVEE